MPEPRRFNALQLLLGALAVHRDCGGGGGRARRPAGSSGHAHPRRQARRDALYWFLDRTSDALPRTGVLSVSLWWYKIAMLAWALWLSFALTRWVKWAWQIYARDGLWRSAPRAPRDAEEPPAGPRTRRLETAQALEVGQLIGRAAAALRFPQCFGERLDHAVFGRVRAAGAGGKFAVDGA